MTKENKTKPIFDRRSTFFFLTAIIFFVVLVRLIISSNPSPSGQVKNEVWTAEKQLQFAHTLANKGLKREAAHAYEEYIKQALIAPVELAKLYYRVGNLYLDMAEYEKALAAFYRVELADPDTELKRETGSRIVSCLENLGMVSEARYELSERTGLEDESRQREPGEVIVARIGKDTISLQEVDAAIDRLQPWLQKQYRQGEGKLNFARQYVASEILYRKAKRLGMDRDPSVRQQVRNIQRQLLVNKIIEDEVKQSVHISPADVERYYQANQERYQEKAKVKVSVIKIADKQKADDISKKITAGKEFAVLAKEQSVDKDSADKGGVIESWIYQGEYIPGLGNNEEANAIIFATTEGEVTPVINAGDDYYFYLVREKKPSRQKPFSEVKEQVEYEYKAEKESEATQELLKRTLEEQEVEFHEELFTAMKQKEQE